MSTSIKVLSLLIAMFIMSACDTETTVSTPEPSKNTTQIEYFDNNTKFVITTNVKSQGGSSGIISVHHYIQSDNNDTELLLQSALKLGKMTLTCTQDVQTGTYIDYNCILYAYASYERDRNSTLRLYDNTTYTLYRKEYYFKTDIIAIEELKH